MEDNLDKEIEVEEVEVDPDKFEEYRKLTPSDSNSYRGSRTIFDEEYAWHRAAGLSHIEAKNKAIDYYRRYTVREVSNSNPEMSDTEFFGADERANPEEEVAFNLMFRDTLNNLQETRQKVAFIIFARAHGCDEMFDETTWKMANDVTEVYPESTKKIDLARACGYAVNDRGNASGFDKLMDRLRDALKLVLGK